MALFPVKRTTEFARCILGASNRSFGSSATNLSVTFPSPPPAGSFVFILFHSSNLDVTIDQPGFEGGLFDYDGFSPTVPLDYAEQFSVITETMGVYAFWKIAGPNEPATYSFTHVAGYAQIVAGVWEIPAACTGVKLRSKKHEFNTSGVTTQFQSIPELIGSRNGELLIAFHGKDNRTAGATFNTISPQVSTWEAGFNGAYGVSNDQCTAVAWNFYAGGEPLQNVAMTDSLSDLQYSRTWAFEFEYPQTYISLDSGFPVVANYTPQSYPAAAGSYDVDITGYTPGRLGIIAIVTDDAGTPDFVTPTGWTRADSGGDSGSSRGTRGLYYKKLEVGETNPVTLALTSGSEPAQASFIEVDNWSGNIADVAFATDDFTTSLLTQTPTQVPLTAPWGVENTLWLVGLLGMDDPATVTTWPVGYETNQRFDHNGNPTDSRCWIAFTHKQEAVGSIAPGAWALSESESCQTFTMAIRAPQPAQQIFAVPRGNGLNGYKIDFRERRAFFDGQSGVFTEHGDLAHIGTPDNHDSLNYYGLACTVDTTEGLIAINPRVLPVGPAQFCECEVIFTDPTPGSNYWCGPAVFCGGDRADTSPSYLNKYAVLMVSANAGDGACEWRLYARRGGTWVVLQSHTSAPDAALAPVRARIEAVEYSDRVELRWWINGQEQTPHTDSLTTRITSKSSTASANGQTAVGLSWGHSGALDTARRVLWVRGGNLPESKEGELVWYTINQAGEVVQITSVDGDDTWADGSSGLIILGSGFTS